MGTFPAPMAGPKNLLPDCGLYLATRPLPGHEEKIPANTLVYFHNHSDSGLPSVLAPAIEFRGPPWADSLKKVPEQGFFTLRKELAFDGGKWPKGAFVQLGYT